MTTDSPILAIFIRPEGEQDTVHDYTDYADALEAARAYCVAHGGTVELYRRMDVIYGRPDMHEARVADYNRQPGDDW